MIFLVAYSLVPEGNNIVRSALRGPRGLFRHIATSTLAITFGMSARRVKLEASRSRFRDVSRLRHRNQWRCVPAVVAMAGLTGSALQMGPPS